MTFIVAVTTIVFVFEALHPSVTALKCGLVECPLYAECERDTQQCICPNLDDSEKIYNPVCGSNDFTYNSAIQLKDHSCNNDLNIIIVHKGKCPQQYRCDSPKCHAESICNITTGKCQCPNYDVSVKRTVCGTDGKDYISKEELLYHACADRSDLKVASHAPCSTRRSQNRDDEDDDEPTSPTTIIVSVVICVVVLVILGIVAWFVYQRKTKSKFTVSKRDEKDFLNGNDSIASI